MSKKKIKRIELYHIGEVLLREVISELTPEDLCEFIKDYESFQDADLKKKLIDYIQNNFSTNQVFKERAQVECQITGKLNQKEYEADPVGRVDVCLFPENSEKMCLPIEVKMGDKGQMLSWNAFSKYNLSDEASVSLQDLENSRYLKGKVPAFLERKLSPDLDKLELKINSSPIEDKGNKYDWEHWLLCTTSEVAKKFNRNSNTPEMPFTFSIQDIIQFATKKKATSLDQYVHKVVYSTLENSREELENELK